MKTFKKRVTITLLLFLSLLPCLSGCGSKKGNSAEPSINETLSAYAEYLQQYYDNLELTFDKEMLRFSLAYIDEDDIPELMLIENSAHAFGVHICVYKYGEVIDVGEFGSFGSFKYSPCDNVIFSHFMGQGASESYLFCIDENKVTKLQMFESYPQMFESYPQNIEVSGDLLEMYIYKVDGQEVSEEEYQEALDKWNIDEMELFRYEDGILFTTVDNPYEEMIKLLSTL